MKLKLKRICKTCGKEFEVHPSQIKVGGGKYCSNECKIKSRIRKIKRVCPICGKQFFTHPCKIKSGIGKYCSVECMGISYRGEKSSRWNGGKTKCICLTCGKEFFLNPSEIELGKGKYCSKNCFGKDRSWRKQPGLMGGKVKCVCQNCKNEFLVYPSVIKNGKGKYSSDKCKNESLGALRKGENSTSWKGGEEKCICEKCGKEFFTPSVERKMAMLNIVRSNVVGNPKREKTAPCGKAVFHLNHIV